MTILNPPATTLHTAFQSRATCWGATGARRITGATGY